MNDSPGFSCHKWMKKKSQSNINNELKSPKSGIDQFLFTGYFIMPVVKIVSYCDQCDLSFGGAGK